MGRRGFTRTTQKKARNVVKEINNLKQELRDIKQLIVKKLGN